ncbi:dGTPase [Jeongeupia sp. USM3]|uniref:dGTPase n=1 Tax=Jeongeupia sp. USM3 TaxID=1906741 RepID=UPI0009F589FB|nr:dGTPase [Jeongeupia sp. USM3]
MNTQSQIRQYLRDFLKVERIRPSEVRGSSLVENAESDRGRVLFSAAFRRLQQKAQVFSLEPNAAVRSRLTHSLEVSQIGRYICDRIIDKLGSDCSDSDLDRSLSIFVETACLMHDIGNPPFGHFGEAAIQDWFEKNGEACFVRATSLGSDFSKKYLDDFIEFDGNPQGLRIISKLQWNNDEFGLNLTTVTMLACLKYLRMAGEIKDDKLKKKAGYFLSEKALVCELWKRHAIQINAPVRFPLTSIMEAADDIAYCISDLEDSIEKELVSLNHAATWIGDEWASRTKLIGRDSIFCQLNELVQKTKTEWAQDVFAQSQYTFTDFRTGTTRVMVEFAAEEFLREAANRDVSSLLPIDSPACILLEILKDYCKKYVYCNDGVQLVEYAGYTAISGLLDIFKPILEASKDRFECALRFENKDGQGKKIVLEKKLLKIFPEKHKKAYQAALEKVGGDSDVNALEWHARTHLVLDFLSGMTDDYAIELYRNLSGIKVI